MTSTHNWDAWKKYIHTAANILAGAETQLQKLYKLTLSDFDVLVTLYTAPERQLSMKSLKANVLVTTSGLSRAVTRMEERGWVTKHTDENDKRAVILKLSAAGAAAFEEIGPVHRAYVRNIFFDALSAKDQEALGVALTHLQDHLDR
ncbi:MAG: MarR family transcriptional regulator [Actinomycetaceae bacterium]|nr:MarR family transcriptional regulator [Actinomycetaceae bacterium]